MMTPQRHMKHQRHIKRCKQAAWNHWKKESEESGKSELFINHSKLKMVLLKEIKFEQKGVT